MSARENQSMHSVGLSTRTQSIWSEVKKKINYMATFLAAHLPFLQKRFIVRFQLMIAS